MVDVSRAVVAAVALLLLPRLASAGPVEWNYKVIDYNPPAPVFAQGAGVTDPALVLFTLARPVFGDITLPDASTYRWNDYDVNVTTRAHVYLTDVASGGSAWRPVDWGVTRTWRKSATGTAWVYEGETEATYRNAANPYEPYLGGNTYQVWVDENRGINVRVLEDTLPTYPEPEPGTLVLAGMGLAAVGVRLRRRTA